MNMESILVLANLANVGDISSNSVYSTRHKGCKNLHKCSKQLFAVLANNARNVQDKQQAIK